MLRVTDEDDADDAEEDTDGLRALLELPRLEPRLDGGGVSRRSPFKS